MFVGSTWVYVFIRIQQQLDSWIMSSLCTLYHCSNATIIENTNIIRLIRHISYIEYFQFKRFKKLNWYGALLIQCTDIYICIRHILLSQLPQYGSFSEFFFSYFCRAILLFFALLIIILIDVQNIIFVCIGVMWEMNAKYALFTFTW